MHLAKDYHCNKAQGHLLLAAPMLARLALPGSEDVLRSTLRLAELPCGGVGPHAGGPWEPTHHDHMTAIDNMLQHLLAASARNSDFRNRLAELLTPAASKRSPHSAPARCENLAKSVETWTRRQYQWSGLARNARLNPMIWIAGRGSEEAMRMLLACPYIAASTSYKGANILTLAASKGRLNMVRAILESARSDVPIGLSSGGRNALAAAIQSGQADMARALLSMPGGSELRCAADDRGVTPVGVAVRAVWPAEEGLLAEMLQGLPDDHLLSALHEAVRCQAQPALRVLLSLPGGTAYACGVDSEGRSALHISGRGRSRRSVADEDARGTVQLLLELVPGLADMLDAPNNAGETAVALAARLGDLVVVCIPRIMHCWGVPIATRGDNGVRPVQFRRQHIAFAVAESFCLPS